jgi:hypothetical protein
MAYTNSPVNDLGLSKDVSIPVHIMLCGVDDRVMLDYLLIDWKTRGSIHTIDQHVTRIAAMMEGQDIPIRGNLLPHHGRGVCPDHENPNPRWTFEMP